MFTLRGTRRLLARLNVAPIAETLAPTTLLGDWYANLVHLGRLQLVLAVNERTYLPVVVAAAPADSLVPRLRAAAGEVLRALDVSDVAVAREDAAMESVVYGKATNRRTIGIMVDFARLASFYVETKPSLLTLSLKLAETPCTPLFESTVSPDKTAVALFTENPSALVH